MSGFAYLNHSKSTYLKGKSANSGRRLSSIVKKRDFVSKGSDGTSSAGNIMRLDSSSGSEMDNYSMADVEDVQSGTRGAT